MPDPVALIQAHNRGRDPELLALKLAAMAESAAAFLRGSCHLFYAGLPRAVELRSAPLAWAAGDLHLENFGSYKADNRQVYFDMNDFDEALLAPASWDLVRLLSSLVVARKQLGCTRATARKLCRRLIESYAQALVEGKPRWLERETARMPVRQLLSQVSGRRRAALLDKRTRSVGSRRRLDVRGKKALPASAAQRAKLERFFDGFAAGQSRSRELKLLDVARRVAGIGSLGVERYVVLVRGKGSPDRNHLLDLKLALPSSSAPLLRSFVRQPDFGDEAERIVAVQRRMQAVSMAFLHAVSLEGQSFVLRRLLPSEDRISLRGLARKQQQLEDLVSVYGSCLAWDQLRCSGRDGSSRADELIAFGHEERWQRGLLELAESAAEQVELDYEFFAEAHADGALSL
jgi:uncharacterized protein (DUF2252 family)